MVEMPDRYQAIVIKLFQDLFCSGVLNFWFITLQQKYPVSGVQHSLHDPATHTKYQRASLVARYGL